MSKTKLVNKINITERKQVEKKIEEFNNSLEQLVSKRTEELQRSKEMLTNAQRIAHLGTWEWNIADNTEVWSDEQFHIFGYEPGDIEPTYNHFLKALHPHDYERVGTAVKEALECSAQYKIEFRIIRPDGTERNIAANGKVYLDTFGNSVKMLGTALDITERKKTEKILQEQKEALEKKNIALNEVLGQIEIEKKQIKDNVIANAENLLLPIIQKLKLTGESRKYVQLLQENLQELTSSFGSKLTEKGAKLTSREIEVCDMIKNGLTSKEIAGLLNISLRTVETHRIKIRTKLGIVNKDINLSSFLKTL